MKKLSILTISYKDPQGLARTLESLRPLLDSTISFEHVIVDSSPLENKAVLEQYKKWPLVYVESEPKGIYPAMNLALSRAQGEYCWFLNGGDELHEIFPLEKILTQLEANQQAAMAWAAADLYRDGAFLYTVFPKKSYLPALVGKNRQCHQAVLYRRHDLLELGAFDSSYKLVADYEHHWRYYLRKKEFIQSDSTLVNYDMSGSSANIAKVYAEFKRVHAELQPKVSLGVALANQLWRAFTYGQIVCMKMISSSRYGEKLRVFWLAWKRM